MVCRNLEIASTLARSSKLDCVTCDGDFVSFKGPMSGGYFGRLSKIESFLNWKNTVSHIEDINQKLTQYVNERQTNEKRLTDEWKKLSSLDIQFNKTKRKLDNLRISKDRIRQQLVELHKKCDSYERSILCLEETLPAMIANRDSFKSELTLTLDSQLSENEQNELDKLLRDVNQLKSDHSDLCKKRMLLEKEKSSLETSLEENLEPRRSELEMTLIEITISDNDTDLETETFDFNIIDNKMKSIRKKYEEKNAKINDLIKQEIDLKVSIENLKLAEEKQLEIVNNEVKKLRKLANKSANFEKKLEECNKKLRNLGTH